MSNNTILVCLAAGLALAGCSTSATPPDTRAADQAAVRKLDADWVKAAQTKQVDSWMAFYAGDAVVLPPNDKVAAGNDSIRKVVADLLGQPGLAITWQPSKAEVARSGDLAYIHGTYEFSWNGSGGKRISEHGKYVEILKKQPDGGWKCIVDTWNSDLPAVPLSASK